ncbi:MAG: dihydrodipicolinate synthase family protein, partial [Candidatus Omnitrophica bacterium]|nr:dihydrodipicolinate synthase family protein [Candidatus Omnitrophota bacterium]
MLRRVRWSGLSPRLWRSPPTHRPFPLHGARPTQAGLEAHFRAVLAAVPLPAVLYNIPGRTGVDLSVETPA